MRKAFIALVAVFLINIPSLYYGWYLKWDWIDVILHFAGGFFVAMFMADYLKDRLVSGQWIKNYLIVVGATIFVGVVWEFAEFIANQTLIEPFYRWFGVKAYFMGDLADTMYDLLMDIFGALVYLSLVTFSKHRNF
ncbi:MAG: hypothetical protein A3B86_04015 [Candidatus Yanofskybacteria bacterium RIFCSPHIGHO2_02_FULL_38_22b]|uniref:Membrane-spanning protein n=1 Tax=Candidatus Yanofskybacteria bacterium RIFCSPHIGHO2_02_FULL_38_22b TaxID=1802673 RepID=A0A1F8EZG1_9BACT|nr:MAG: hypothetical protein A2816_01785 [Candidatus Yanofskybacteria bacterium RIFCSPHIGHO2_01_FULL_39_44]OGN06257.1 MAG: hypothetical protein A3B86_04015 [Candidatus Yanofskybacteria bacterium RIFCSPHIGHO2_02_FULL_38_22b]OGN19677.1 MAG: hypothetical protein A2910_03750 [Candidatus Yanofskybacteria bacterium RIFCSPLOWO2_01_FULL_39_28]